MTTMNTDPIVTDYLHRLETAAAGLPTDERAELVADVSEHIDSALRDARTADEVTVRNVLERLGPPEDIVSETTGPGSMAPQGDVRRDGRDIAALVILCAGFLAAFLDVVVGRARLDPTVIAALAVWAVATGHVAWRVVTRAPRGDRGGSLEIAAIVLLTAGGFVWAIWSWLAGYVLVVLSNVWNTRDKAVVPLVTVLLMPLGWTMTSPWFGAELQLRGAVTFACGLGGLLGGIYLSWRLVQVRHRATAGGARRRWWLAPGAVAVVIGAAALAAGPLGGTGTEEACEAGCGPATTVDQFARIRLAVNRQDVALGLGMPDRTEGRWQWGPRPGPHAVQTQVPPGKSQYDDCWMYDLHTAGDNLAHGAICFVADTVVYTDIEPAE